MNLLRTVAVAFAMFSAVPVPQVKWDRDSLRYALCAFPLVGALVAGVAGLMTSYYLGPSAGASITLYLAVWFALTFLLRKK